MSFFFRSGIRFRSIGLNILYINAASSYRSFVSARSPNGLPDGEASEQIGGRASLM